MGSVVWVGLVITIIGFVIDGILWSFVFNKGMEHLMHLSKEEAGKAMGRLMGTQIAAQLVFGYFFSLLWALVGHAMPVKGIAGGLLFAVVVWVPTVAYAGLANSIWYGKSRSLANATAWTALAKFLVAGSVLSFLI